ncbi:MAG: TIGR03435 family protein, partial [Candidatus Sulfotelmatobacter sp.]
MRTVLVLFVILSISSHAQTSGAQSKSFVIADVHTSPFTSNPFMHGNSIQGDRYFLTQATMAELIATAYGVDVANVQGGPTWLERDHYDIRAKVPPKTTPDDVKLML